MLGVFNSCPPQSLWFRPSAWRVCVSDGGAVWLSTMAGNQSHNSTCLSVSQMGNSGTHTNTHTTKNYSLNYFFNNKLLLNCLSVQSSVMERRLTAGVWTRTAGRFLALDHTMSSNLHVSIFTPVLHVCLRGERNTNYFYPSCLVPGLPSAAPPTVRPLPRPDVTPPTNADITLLYAQGQKIGALPLNGTRLDATRAKTLLTLHVRDERINTHILY